VCAATEEVLDVERKEEVSTMGAAAPWVLQSLIREASIGLGLGFIGGMVWHYGHCVPELEKVKKFYANEK